LILLVARRGC